ncbi:metal-dependent hydrolase [uncultured Maricaulis sp.]|uniref:metal-dependent hydrolase n=1 Tax=uncultured Maricaulis sp. TaxID=174710 RepID=UPI0026315FD8|nr:metal-dependent hydrolase [uncultured Maricaulis sp.]
MPRTKTPTDLVITPRNRRFKDTPGRGRWWMGGDAVATAWHNALSVTFPAGETFFIESVRRFQKSVPDELAAQIKDFARQEAFHTREHNAFNQRVIDDGYDVSDALATVEESLAHAREGHPVAQLSITVSLEHFTAIFAHLALKDVTLYADTDRESQRMWLWHAIEEVEHKSVAFDTYAHIMRDVKPLKRWGIRCTVFARVSRDFVFKRWRECLALLAQDGITGLKARSRLAWYLWGRPGVLRRVLPAWFAYFQPGFHPWQIDDRHLIAETEARLDLAEPVAAE